MTDKTATVPPRTVRMSRRFDAAPEAVFRAWTDPAEVAQWYGPTGWSAPRERIRIDGAIGGRWEVTMVRDGDAFEFPIGYEILELDPPRLIVLRYVDMTGSTSADPAVVRVELTPDGDGTLLTLTDGPMPAEGSDGVAHGYGQAFDKLATRLGLTRPS